MKGGLARVEECFAEVEAGFWESYCVWAVERWAEVVKELTVFEWRRAYEELGLEHEPSANGVWFRRDAEKRFRKAPEREQLFRAANHYLVYDEFLWTAVDQWPVEEWAGVYGKGRTTWLVLNLPLPEELEKYRTEKLAALIPRKPHDKEAPLWERIRQLGYELERQRRRAAGLSAELQRARQDRARLETELSLLREEIRALREQEQQRGSAVVEDSARVRRLKGLISELRAEVKRLESLLPTPVIESSTPTQEEPAPAVEEGAVSLPQGYTIAAFGFQKERSEVNGATILWHHGDRWDKEAEVIIAQADAAVILTRTCSHEVMWAVKEYAADTGLLVGYSRGSGVESVLREVAKHRTGASA